MLTRLTVLIFTAITLLFAETLSAQVVVSRLPSWPDSSAAVLTTRFAQVPWGLTTILRQETKPQSRARLDELADSMVALILRNARRGADGESAASVAISALSSAGLPSDGKETQYPGAIERLIRIYRDLPDGDRMRLYVVWTMRPSEQANEFLYQVATSHDPAAAHAMSMLLTFLTPETDQYRAGTPALRAPLEARLRALAKTANREQDSSFVARARPGVMQVAEDGYAPSLPNLSARTGLLVFASRAKWDLSMPE